ncbi:MAG: hypothetical protein AAB308_12260 [Nitrospirota bacterium]
MPITVVEQGPPVHDHARSVPETPLGFPRRYSFGQTLRSRYHAFWYHLGKRLAWSRGIYRERPAERLQHLSGIQQERMASLRRRFRVRFEQRVEQLTALKRYDYLDILAQAWSAWKLPHPTGGVVQDIGSSNFWYAAALHAFFRPTELVGIEVEGHRIYINGYSRLDYAHGYIEDLPNTTFFVGDYTCYHRPADVVTAWYPFVTPDPVLAWRMPLSVLDPIALFSRVAHNLPPHGLFIMVNQDRKEAAIAAAWCEQVGLARYGSCEIAASLRPRLPAVASCWRRSHT